MRNKIFKVLFIGLFIFFNFDVSSFPWNNNTREHLFGYIDRYNQARVTIEDEGFRWRDSFDFIINGQNIQQNNWYFQPAVYYDRRAGFAAANIYYNNYSSNLIHSHLSKIAWNVKTMNACSSASAAAVTIVISHAGVNYAFSKVISEDNRAYVATTNGNEENYILNYVNHNQNIISTNISSIINCNIPQNRYCCTEGKLLSVLTDNNLAIFKSTIRDLLQQAQQKIPSAVFNYGSIGLVVLHIGTTMDPCAICTRCLVGISKCINENIDNFLRSTVAGAPAGNMNNTKFLVEVSSNGHYAGGCPLGRNDSFNNYGCGICSHTECAGQDGGKANPINISLNFTDASGLAIPYGTETPWGLSRTFPPYVVFGRVNSATHAINLSPAHNQPDGGCHNRRANAHLKHNYKILPLVK